jgi:hypothetical protein
MRHSLLALLLLAPVLGWCQYDSDLAYLPNKAPSNTADDVRVGFSESVVAGSVDLILPSGTEQVDLLNGRGEVVQRLDAAQLDRLDLDSLKPGTWTLRARVNGHFLVRRFLVIGKGNMAWIPEQEHRRSGPKKGRVKGN